METKNIALLVITATISFAIGRVIMHLRKRKKAEQQRSLAEQAQRALKDLPPEPPSTNKGKRKRQQLEAARAQASQKR